MSSSNILPSDPSPLNAITLAPVGASPPMETEEMIPPKCTKRRRVSGRTDLSSSELSRKLDELISSQPTPEMAILYLIGRYKFDINELYSRLHERQLNVSFSKVTYSSIAGFVGLDPERNLRDAPDHKLQRARLPTHLFKEIISDMHISLNQYGPPQEHQNEEARSRFIAPLMNRIVAQFSLLILNTPECLTPGRMATKGCIEYQFKVCGALTVLFVEVKLQVGSATERLNAVAQVIAEADACDFMNSKIGFSTPIHAVLCDGYTFEFFIFDGSTSPPRLSRGLVQRPNGNAVYALSIPRYELSEPIDFINALRPICETFYAMFLTGYIAGLNAYYDRSVARATEQGRPRDSTPAWLRALGLAKKALELGVQAAELFVGGDLDAANEATANGWDTMKASITMAPKEYRRDDCNLLGGWDENLCQ